MRLNDHLQTSCRLGEELKDRCIAQSSHVVMWLIYNHNPAARDAIMAKFAGLRVLPTASRQCAYTALITSKSVLNG